MDFNEFIKNENTEKTITTPFGNIVVPKERNLYNEIRKRYKVLSLNSVELFAKAYDSYESCEDIIDNAYTDFQKSIVNIIEEIK